jgi:BirA family biotin operon repressor/biotin-[acetyl-CoA-carboxylase] ligase
MFSHSQIRHALAGERFGHPLHYFQTIGSTNQEAKQLASDNAPEGTLVIADEQTAGRGRLGREWITPRGSDLASTFVLRPNLIIQRLGHMALMGGLAAAQAIENTTGLSPQLKWPNDVCIEGRKVCGVLAETSIRNECIEWVVLGIGINVNLGPPSSMMVNRTATSLATEVGRKVDRLALLVNLSKELDAIYSELGSQAILDAWEARMLWRGKLVRVLSSSSSSTDEGVLLGLTPEGLMRLQHKDGGEVAVSDEHVSLVRG